MPELPFHNPRTLEECSPPYIRCQSELANLKNWSGWGARAAIATILALGGVAFWQAYKRDKLEQELEYMNEHFLG